MDFTTLQREPLLAYSLPDFQAIFQAIPGNYLIVQPNSPTFTILAVSDQYNAVTNTDRSDILGKLLFEVFPDNPEDPNADGVANLTASLEEVIRERKVHRMKIQKYDIPNADGSFSVKYWSPTNSPVLDSRGEVRCIIHNVIDITEQVETKKKLKILQVDEQVHELFMQAPVAISIVRGEDNIISLANDRMLELWGKDAQIIGKRAQDMLPELKEQGFAIRSTQDSKNRRCQTPLFLWAIHIERNRKFYLLPT